MRVTVAAGIASAREVDGQEKQIGSARIQDATLVTDLQPFRLRAFALRLAAPAVRAVPADFRAVSLPYNLDAVSSDSNRSDGAFDSQGRTFAAEQLPGEITSEGIQFAMGPQSDGQKNTVVCRGQAIELPAAYQRVYILAAAVDGDQPATFKIADHSVIQTIHDWGGYIGQWDNRLWDHEIPETSTQINAQVCGLVPGFVKRASVAWFCSHRHHPTGGNEFYQYSYLFKYGFNLPDGATSLTLPDNEKVRVFAMTVAKGTHDDVSAARPLFDTLEDHTAEPTTASISPNGGKFSDVTPVVLGHALYWNSGGLHYTIDGSEPTARSPVYSKPIQLSSSAKIRVMQFDASGHGGPEVSADFEVNDTTAPVVRSVSAVSIVPTIRVVFSEPLNQSEAQTASNYRLDPPLQVEGAALSDDGTAVTLALAKPLSTSAHYRLAINGVGDASPAGNKIKLSEPLSVAVALPVFSLDHFTAAGKSKEQRIAELPVKAKEPWSINLFVRTDEQPENRTIIAGFGRDGDEETGTGRYLCKFSRGVHFWSRMCDVDGRRTPLELHAWQMLSATYDGQSMRLYKDSKQINEREISLADDEPIVRLAPLDPWDHSRQFRGEIQNFTIWNAALSPEALKVLKDSGPQRSPGRPPTTSEAAR